MTTFRRLFASALLLLAVPGLFAGDIYWQATNSQFWTDASSWNPQMLPGAASMVHIDSHSVLLQGLTTTVSSIQNNGSANVQLGIGQAGILTVTNGITAGSNPNSTLNINFNGGATNQTIASLTLGGASTIPGYVDVGAGYLNLQNNATASIGSLYVSAPQGASSIVTVGYGANSGAQLTVGTLGMNGYANINGLSTYGSSGLDVNGGSLAATQNFSLAGGVVISLVNGATASLTGTADLGQAYGGGPELDGGSLTNGAVITGDGSTLKLGSDLDMSGATDGIIQSGIYDTKSFTITNTSASTINLVGGILRSISGSPLVFTGNMNFVNNVLDGSAGGAFLEGTNYVPIGGTWEGYVNLTSGSVTTVSGQITEGAEALNVNLLGTAQLIVNNDAPLQGGTYNIGADAQLEMDSGYLDGATVNSSGSFYVPNGYTQVSGTTAVNGSLDAGGNDVDIDGGMLQGDGTVTGGSVDVGDATIKGGDSPGTLTINGNLNLTSTTTTLVQIGGLTAGSQFDVIAVDGTANLAGALDVELLNLSNGYTPAIGNEFTFLTCADGCDGTFSGVDNADFKIVYNADSVELEIVGGPPALPPPGAPEPGTWMMLAACLAVLWGRQFCLQPPFRRLVAKCEPSRSVSAGSRVTAARSR